MLPEPNKELMKLCVFYRGEEQPDSLLTKSQRKIWAAEMMCCTEFQNVILQEKDTEQTLHRMAAAYIGKWDPYGAGDVISEYERLLNL